MSILDLKHVEKFEECLEVALRKEGIGFTKTRVLYDPEFQPNKLGHFRYIDNSGNLITDYYIEMQMYVVYDKSGEIPIGSEQEVFIGEWHYSTTDTFVDFFEDNELPDENRLFTDERIPEVINSIIVAYNLRIGNKKPVSPKQKYKTASLVESAVEGIKYGLESEHKTNGTVIFVQPANDKRSESYIKSKQKVLEKVGLNSITIKLPENVTDKYMNDLVKFLNRLRVPSLIQLPIKGVDEKVVRKLDPAIDIDRFSYGCEEYNDTYYKKLYPCTPTGICTIIREHYRRTKPMLMSRDEKYMFDSLTITVIGRGELVGAPLSEMLRDYGATVLIANSRTDRRTLKKMIEMSDVVVSATGHHGTISQEMLTDFRHKNLLIVDAGVSFVNGKLKGDFKVNEDYMWLYPNITYTPCIGGVGPMTVVSVAINSAKLINNLDVLNNNYIRNVLKESGYDYE